MMKVTDDGACVVAIYERYKEMIKQYGAPQRDDEEFWGLNDLMTHKEATVLAEWAFESRFMKTEDRMWIMKRLRERPFQIRHKQERYKQSQANKVIWKMLMNGCETIDRKLKTLK
jgi:hypothetical protein